mgnify:CR=1 FL=1
MVEAIAHLPEAQRDTPKVKDLAVMLLAVPLMVGLSLFVSRTRLGKLYAELLVERVAVGETCQRVVLGEVLDSFLFPLSVRDIAHHRAILDAFDALRDVEGIVTVNPRGSSSGNTVLELEP